jgi:hypothetical protein
MQGSHMSDSYANSRLLKRQNNGLQMSRIQRRDFNVEHFGREKSLIGTAIDDQVIQSKIWAHEVYV